MDKVGFVLACIYIVDQSWFMHGSIEERGGGLGLTELAKFQIRAVYYQHINIYIYSFNNIEYNINI